MYFGLKLYSVISVRPIERYLSSNESPVNPFLHFLCHLRIVVLIQVEVNDA